jgi:type III pantothenate kinase
MSLLCIDVENTHTTVGVFEGADLDRRWLLSTQPTRTADEWRLLLTGLLDAAGIPAIDGVCICCTVPAVLQALRSVLAETFAAVPSVVLGPGVRTGLPVLMDNPREVGTDRIANALAAIDLVSPPCVVVALGTATTFDVVNQAGQYIGGAIAPGLEISVAALADHAAQLRKVELTRPRNVVAKNTVEALQSGAVFGGAGLVDGIVYRVADELGVPVEELTVIATGVLAPAVVAECETVSRHEPDLTLHGMRIAFDRNG